MEDEVGGQGEDRTIGEKIDCKERKVEKSKRIKHTTWAHGDDAWDVRCARQTYNLSHACACEPTRKCDVWGVLFTLTVGCSRLLSAVNDLTTTKKILQSVTSEQLCEEVAQRVAPFYMLLFHELRCAWLWWILMSSTSDRSTATVICWMKKTTDAISDIAKKESVQIALLQTHGEDGAIWLMFRWSLHGVSSVHWVQMCWERSTYSFCIWSSRLATCDSWSLSARPCPSGCILLQFDQFWVANHEMLNLSGRGREFVQNSFRCISFSNYGQYCAGPNAFWFNSPGPKNRIRIM